MYKCNRIGYVYSTTQRLFNCCFVFVNLLTFNDIYFTNWETKTNVGSSSRNSDYNHSNHSSSRKCKKFKINYIAVDCTLLYCVQNTFHEIILIFFHSLISFIVIRKRINHIHNECSFWLYTFISQEIISFTILLYDFSFVF